MNVCREHLLRDIIVRWIGHIEFLFCKLYVISLSEERKNKRKRRNNGKRQNKRCKYCNSYLDHIILYYIIIWICIYICVYASYEYELRITILCNTRYHRSTYRTSLSPNKYVTFISSNISSIKPIDEFSFFSAFFFVFHYKYKSNKIMRLIIYSIT